jgi:hypothetical protein
VCGGLVHIKTRYLRFCILRLWLGSSFFFLADVTVGKALGIVYRQKKTSEFGKLQSLDSQLLAKSLISCLAVVGAHPEKKPSGSGKNFGSKTSDLGHIQILRGTSPC